MLAAADELAELLAALDPTAAVAEPVLTDAVVQLVGEYGAAMAEVGAQLYEHARDVAGVTSRFVVPVADPAPPEQITGAVSWALHQTVKGDDGAVAPTAEQIGTRLDGAVQKLVRQPERQTIAEAVTADPAASRWAREPTGPRTCHFCALMCTRGAVYRSEESGGRDADRRFVGHGEFKFHDNCDCRLVPVFRGRKYIAPAHVRQWDALYAKATAGVHGMRGKQRAWRQAFDAHQTEHAESAPAT